MEFKETQEPNLTAQSQSEKSSQGSSYPTFVDLLAIFGCFILTQIVGLLLAHFILPLTSVAFTSAFQQACELLICQAVSIPLLLLFIGFLRRKRGAERPRLKFNKSGFDPTALLAGFVMMLTMTVVIEPILALLPAVPAIEARGWPLLVSVVILAPLLEEILCRGVIYESLRSRYGIFLAWIISSAVFGLMHVPSPAMVVNAFFMGLILCYFYICSRSLYASIILHMLNNALAYIFIVLGWGEGTMLRDVVTNNTIYTIIYVISLLILAISTVLCARQFKKIIARNEAQSSPTVESNITQDEESLQ